MNNPPMTILLNVAVLFSIPCFFCSCVQAATDQRPKREGIRVLIVDGFSNHNWKQTTLLTKKILESSGLFSVDVSTAPSTKGSTGWDEWRPSFAKYDVVVQTCNRYGGRPTRPSKV